MNLNRYEELKKCENENVKQLLKMVENKTDFEKIFMSSLIYAYDKVQKEQSINTNK